MSTGEDRLLLGQKPVSRWSSRPALVHDSDRSLPIGLLDGTIGSVFEASSMPSVNHVAYV